jgi:hypothetical protein
LASAHIAKIGPEDSSASHLEPLEVFGAVRDVIVYNRSLCVISRYRGYYRVLIDDPKIETSTSI